MAKTPSPILNHDFPENEISRVMWLCINAIPKSSISAKVVQAILFDITIFIEAAGTIYMIATAST